MARRRTTADERAAWRCDLCGRGEADIGVHPLPVQQRAHLLPNRLTGAIKRYGGVKNPFTETEWTTLLHELGPDLEKALPGSDDMRLRATHHCYHLCGECHEEVLSEPVYLPSVVAVLARHFRGASRVQKVLALTRLLKLGAEALEDKRVRRAAQQRDEADEARDG
jgi:hypothetical protein